MTTMTHIPNIWLKLVVGIFQSRRRVQLCDHTAGVLMVVGASARHNAHCRARRHNTHCRAWRKGAEHGVPLEERRSENEALAGGGSCVPSSE